MGDTVVSLTGGGGGGSSAIMLIVVVIAAFIGLWMWRSGKFSQQPQQQVVAPPAAPATTPTAPGGTAPLPSCNCTTNSACNSFCDNPTAFNLCCSGGSSTVPPVEEEEDLPDPSPSLCSSLYNGKCNTECGANGDIDTCEECNATCATDVPYTGPDIEVPAPAGGATGGCNCASNAYCNNFCSTPSMFSLCCYGQAQAAPAPATPSCPSGYIYDEAYDVCRQSAPAAPAVPTCPSGYVYNPTYNVCQQSAPTQTSGGGANPTVCKNTYNGSCNTECSSGSTSLCNSCMIACGTASAGGAVGGTSGERTPECKSKYNGSCNTECSSGSTSVCNACKVACGLSGNIARVYTAKDARRLLNNRLYNSLRAKRYMPRAEVAIGYTANRRGHFRIGNI